MGSIASRCFAALLLLGSCGGVTAWPTRAADTLEQGFLHPPDATKPWVYWYWISDNISKEGLSRDLEAMARVGIDEAFIGNIFLGDVPRGNVRALTEEWWGMIEHALREAGRVGVHIGLFNCPGWSQSGGPWIKPDQAMRHLVSSETRVKGPARFHQKLSLPKEPFQQVAVLAFPVPRGDTDTVAAHAPRITCSTSVADAERMVDGDRETACLFPPGLGAGPLVLELELARDFTARSLALHPAHVPFAAQCELSAADDQGRFQRVRAFPLDRSNTNLHVGPLPYGPVAVAFPPITARRFRLTLSDVRGQGGLAEIELSGAARLEHYVEKQLGKMHPTPLPMWDTYLWPRQAEPEAAELAVPPGAILDLSQRVQPDGTLEWDVPAGDWIILRTGMTPTGTQNAPASPEGTGLEVDKMNRHAAAAHFNAFIGKLLARMPKTDRATLRHVVADSYEMGSQNWTDGFARTFQRRYGYDARRWLPVLTGRLVGSADQSDRFLWDLRRLVADHVARDYVGGLRDLCQRHGLELWLENYGHWGFPAEFLQYGGQSHRLGGEFWAGGDLGSIELRAAASACHIYGLPVTSAESFTAGGPHWLLHPWVLKQRGDWAWTEGVNHSVLHVYIHQPWEDRRPGVNAWFGTEFNRHNTWFEQSRAWIDYLRRSSFLLQQGRYVAEVAYFIGEDTPKMTGRRQPELPAGYSFDYINAEVLEERMVVKEGRFVLPDGMGYRLLVLPELETMRPGLLRQLRALIAAGGAVLGVPPSRSPSLEDYPACDAQVRKLATEIWGLCDGRTVTSAPFGKGRVFRGLDLRAVLDQLHIPPDVAGVDQKQVAWTHRATPDADIYFLSNQTRQRLAVNPVFRVKGRLPGIWHPDTGRIVQTARFRTLKAGTEVPIELEATGSAFVVFRAQAGEQPAVAELTRDGQPDQAQVVRISNGGLEARLWTAGSYRLKLASGETRAFEAKDLPAPFELAGPWEVLFPSGMDVPERVTLDGLASWTEHPAPAIRHFSGTAVYTKRFELPPEFGTSSPKAEMRLDLGRVEVMAEVFLNGQNLGVLWKPPFMLDVTGAVRPGTNTLEVRVVNLWRNRLIGDKKYPRGFGGEGNRGGAAPFKPFLSTDIGIRPDEPLVPSGLLGPIRFHRGLRLTVP